MPHVEGAGVALHYLSRGEGPAVVLVHGMASDALAWEPALAELAAGGLRAVALDRRGYGASGAPEPYAATTVQEQAEDVAALALAIDAAPALLVGEGFGALVVLELLVRRPELARAAVLADPPLHAFVPARDGGAGRRAHAARAGLRDGGPAAAVRAWLGGAGVAEDDARVPRAVAAARGFFADYAGQSSWSPSRGELRAIAVPVAVVTGPAHARRTWWRRPTRSRGSCRARCGWTTATSWPQCSRSRRRGRRPAEASRGRTASLRVSRPSSLAVVPVGRSAHEQADRGREAATNRGRAADGLSLVHHGDEAATKREGCAIGSSLVHAPRMHNCQTAEAASDVRQKSTHLMRFCRRRLCRSAIRQ